MVVLGGLEIAAVGFLLNEFNKDKIEERERRKQSHNRPEHDYHDRPHSRPHSNSRPPPPAPFPQRHDNPHASNSNLLAPPQGPMRPLSAPPQDPRPEWQRQQGYQQGQQMGPPFQHQQPTPNGPQQRPPQGPSGDAYAFQSQLWQKQQAQQAQQHRPSQSQPSNLGPGPNQKPLWQPGPQPGPQGPAQFNSPPQQHNNFMNGPPPPGPGHLQRPQTFQPGQQNQPNQPYVQSSNAFPQHQQGPPQPFLQHQSTFPPQNTPPQQSQSQSQPGPLVYINTKTGKVSHNLYPPDHPMHRPSMSSSSSTNLPNFNSSSSGDFPKELWGDEKYTRAMAGDVHTGMMWSERDEDDLAYGKDYSAERERRKREKARARSGSGNLGVGREHSYERVRTGSRGGAPEWV